MPQFSPDQVTFQDVAGYGMWDIGHAREHTQFVQVLAQQTPAINVDDFPLLAFLTGGFSRGSAVQAHNQAHVLLHNICGFTGTDYTGYNLDDQNDFNSFLSYHAVDHQQIRQFLGII